MLLNTMQEDNGMKEWALQEGYPQTDSERNEFLYAADTMEEAGAMDSGCRVMTVPVVIFTLHITVCNAKSATSCGHVTVFDVTNKRLLSRVDICKKGCNYYTMLFSSLF